MHGRLITAWRIDTGAQVQIPEHWLGTPLGDPFTTDDPTTEPQPTPDPEPGTPAQDAAARPDGAKKAPGSGATNPPAAGDKKE